MPSKPQVTFNLVALVAHGNDRDRLVSAFRGRRVEILDEMLSGTRGRMSVVAVVGPDRSAEVFVSGDDAARGGPSLCDVRPVVEGLIHSGCFQHGAALVLGRRYDHRARNAGDYPELLRTLSTGAGDDLADRCAGGIAGIGRDASSLTSTILWWEFARATRREPGLATVHALRRARSGFSALRAPWQAGLASSARRRAERALQPSFLDAPDALEIDPLRFEVVPALLVACDATTGDAWAVPSGGPSLSWRHLGRVRLTLTDDCEPDYGTTPLAMRRLRRGWHADGLVDVEVSVDFQVRVSLGIDTPSPRERIRYTMVDDGTFVQPRSTLAPAGATVVLRCDPDALRREPVLTCTSSLGHLARFDLVERGALRTDDGSGDSHASGIAAQAA